MNLPDLIAVARGDRPADLLLKNAGIINVFTSSIEKSSVAVYGNRIAGIGDYTDAAEIIDLRGAFLSPGFINGHIHIESSMLHPANYARTVVPHGTTSISTDLHEITNVSGMAGIRFVLHCARDLPLDFFFQAASCVPATHMETSGASITASDIRRLLKWKNNIGLGEMMNYPGVINAFPPVIDEIYAARDHVIAGHAPGLRGKQLNAYVSAGIYSDHENSELEESREKLSRGLFLMIREGTSEKNLEDLIRLVTDKTWHRCMFVVDDRSCSDLLRDGDVDAVVRKAIGLGLDPIRAIQLVTLNPAEYFRLHDLGRIAPGSRANLVTIKNLEKLDIDMVFYNGNLAAKGGRYLGSTVVKTPARLMKSVNYKPFKPSALELISKNDHFPVIEIVPGQIITKKQMVKIGRGEFQPDTARDLLKAVVVERHKATGNIGLGIVRGFGLKQGAIASTIAHDSHNIVVVGAGDKDILAAIEAVRDMQGGLVVCRDGKPIARLPLPICGLLSTEPAEKVSTQFEYLERVAAGLGKLPPAPFALLSFIALPVIPELRLTDKGIVDVVRFKLLTVV
ncbi:MAG: adenine deaminase [Dehalococcoidia bacterium]|nr:adenine deaminase [Dehalococcoidia bacterium]